MPKDVQRKGLQGHLEDLPLLDILQIVAFSKKTGYLRLEGPLGKGAMVFKGGLVVCAYSWSTRSYLDQIVDGKSGDASEAILRQQIEISLRELMGLREGAFYFQLTEAIASDLDGVDISPFLQQEGVDPQHLLLGLAKDMDEEREDTTALIEAASESDSAAVPQQDRPAEPPAQVVPEPPAETATVAEPAMFVEPATIAEPAPIPEPEPIAEPAMFVAPATVAEPATIAEPAMFVESATGAEPDTRSRQVDTDTTLVLVDDEPEVIEVVGAELRSRGYRVSTASDPIEGAALVRRRVAAGERVVLVADVRMPTSTGRSFFGGFELVRRVNKSKLSVPILLMAERLSEKARTRARELGITKVAFKPSVSKLDLEDYKTDLRSFASILASQVAELTVESPAKGKKRTEPEAGEDSLLTDFLKTMTQQLVNRRGSLDISQMVLRVASKYFDRGILFLIREGVACGVGGFGLAETEKASMELAKKVAVDLHEAKPFAEVVHNRSALRIGRELDGLESSLFATIGRGRSQESVLLPMLHNRDVLTILYGDNPATGRDLGDLPGLELFLAQAGMALENVFLHRRLRRFESKLSPASDQGPVEQHA